MTVKVLPASAGFEWWQSSLSLFLRAPLALVGASVLPLLAYGIVSVLLVGISAALINSMALTLIVMILLGLIAFVIVLGIASVFRGVDRGEKASLSLFLHPATEKALPLVALFVLYAIATTVALIIAVLVGGGLSLLNSDTLALIGSHPGSVDSLEFAGILMAGMLKVMLIYLILLIFIVAGFWLAPFLIGWRNESVFSAIGLSFVGVMKNWAAYLVNFFIYFGVVSALGTAIMFVFWILGSILPEGLITFLFFALYIAFALILMPITYGNWYYGYKAIFEDDETPAESAATA